MSLDKINRYHFRILVFSILLALFLFFLKCSVVDEGNELMLFVDGEIKFILELAVGSLVLEGGVLVGDECDDIESFAE